jgi:hypothetical protein
VPVALTLVALVALLARRPALGMALVGAGAATKGFPLVVAPVALAWLLGAGDRRAARRGALALGVTLAAVGVAWLALSPQGAVDSLAYQLDRPVQVESAPASVLLGIHALGGEPPRTIQSHASAALAHPLAAPVGMVFVLALVTAIAVLGTGAWRAGRLASRTDAARGLVLAALGAVVAFAGLGRVLSPQYLVWGLPLLALAVAWRAWALAVATGLGCALTLAEFPSRYFDLVDGEPAAVAIVAARNSALLAALWLAAMLLVRLAPTAGRRALRAGAGAPARSIGPARPAPPR